MTTSENSPIGGDSPGEGTGSAWPPDGWIAPRRITVDAGAVMLGALMYEPQPTDGASFDPGSLDTIVLLHGWADLAWSLDTLAQALAFGGRPRRVISLDMRGHGHSDRGPYQMVHLVGDVRGAFEKLGLETDPGADSAADRPIVIGHSLGAQVLAQFSGIFPDLVRALITIEGIGPPLPLLADEDPDAFERLTMVRNVERSRQRLSPRSLPSVEFAIERLLRSHTMLDPHRARFLVERNTVRDANGELWWRFDPASRDWLNGHSAAQAAQRWRGITCPVLAINGSDSFDRYWQPRNPENDYPGPLAGAMLEARLAEFADVRFVEISGGGHMLHYDKPQELNTEVLRFVEEQSR